MPDPDVLILGGGYAGLMAAARCRLGGARVTVVDPRPRFVHRVRLHEAAAGHAPAELPWARVLPAGVRHLAGRAEALSGAGATIRVDGTTVDVSARCVVLATGSRIRQPWVGPTVRALETQADAARIHRESDGRAVVVLGAGPTGVEVAAALAEVGRDVTLVDPRGLPGLSHTGVSRLAAMLDSIGVRRVQATAHSVGPDTVHTSVGPVAAGLVVPCAGFEASPLARAAGLPVDADGRVRLAPDLSVAGLPGLFVAGDAGVIPAQPWVGTGCVSAMPLGAHAASSALAWLGDRPSTPFSWRWMVKQIAVGRRGALAQGLTWDGQPTWAAGGRWGAITKAAVNAAVPRVARFEATLGRPAYGWPGPPQSAFLPEPA